MALVDTAPAIGAKRPSSSFFSQPVDFLCLGGGSLLLIPILALTIPDSFQAGTLLFALLLSNVINHPHFAHSYQIFYRTYSQVMRQPDTCPTLRLRYLWAGLISPVVIAGALAAAVLSGDKQIVGYASNAMGFFVGWHYVKQGYGMIMVDAARLRSYFTERQKKVLLVNSYSCWGLSWTLINQAIAEQELLGFSYAAISMPLSVVWAFAAAVAVSSLLALVTLVQHARAHDRAAPVNGILAYVAALYPWLLLGREPIVGVLIPAFHSLQYLVIVWRVQLNVERTQPGASEQLDWSRRYGLALRRETARFAGFLGRGFVLGLLGFWVLPLLADLYLPYDRAEFGPSLFLFLFWIFINIHHYFIDNAMWRKENPHTMAYLFSHRAAAPA